MDDRQVGGIAAHRRTRCVHVEIQAVFRLRPQERARLPEGRAYPRLDARGPIGPIGERVIGRRWRRCAPAQIANGRRSKRYVLEDVDLEGKKKKKVL